jgi:LacI family transcriptional regulator
VFSGKRPTSSITKKKVFEVAQKLNYVPNYAAQALSSKKTFLVAVLVNDISDSYTAALVEQFGAELAKHKYIMLLEIVRSDPAVAINNIMKLSNSGMVDGIINLVSSLGAEEASSISQSVPVISYARKRQECPSYIDFYSGTIKAIQYLWQLGHRKIALITENDPAPELIENESVLAYENYMKQNSLDISFIKKFNHLSYSEQDIDNVCQEFYASNATAILAENDNIGLMILQWAYKVNVRIPDDLSVMTLKDSINCMRTTPMMSSMKSPNKEIVAATVDSLLYAIDEKDEPCEEKILVPELVIRETTRKLEHSKALFQKHY